MAVERVKIVLDKVYNELSSVAVQLDNQIAFIKNITKIPFQPAGQMLREYAILKNRFGDGESACMAYCRFTSNIIGSSNLRDIKNYCADHKITYLTTVDFLYFAWRKGLMTVEDCRKFIYDVKAKGSRLPDIDDISQHTPVCSI